MADSGKLKIHTKYQAGAYGATTVPEIRLVGKWLDTLGFKEGQTVNIAQRKNKLTITIGKGNR